MGILFIFFRITTFIALYILVTYCRMYSDKILDEWEISILDTFGKHPSIIKI